MDYSEEEIKEAHNKTATIRTVRVHVSSGGVSGESVTDPIQTEVVSHTLLRGGVEEGACWTGPIGSN